MINIGAKRIVLLVAVSMVSASLAVAVPKKFREQGTHSAGDELALARDIATVKEKLAEYKISQSFFDSLEDVAVVTAMGAVMGALAGLGHMLLSKSLMDDFACLIPSDQDSNSILFSAQGLRIATFALQGCSSGFWLGVAGSAGSLPQMSKPKIAFVLALQNVIAAALALGADHLGMHLLESQVEDCIRKGATGEVGVAVAKAAGRRTMFRTVAAGFVGKTGDKLNQKMLITMPELSTLVAQFIAVFLIVPEAFEVRSSRKNANKKMMALKDALRKLEQSMDCAEIEETAQS